MIEAFSQFHFIRPWWFIALIPLAWAVVILWKKQQHSTGFEPLVAPELMPYLTTGQAHNGAAWPLYGLIILWLVATIALAGPTWKQQPRPVYQTTDALVLLLDLSPSMLSNDLAPSRIERARFKIRDLLAERGEGLTGLIVYAGEAHIVSPLTDDTNTIDNLLPTLAPGLLPIPGSNPEMAIDMGQALIKDAGLARGRLIMITDGIDKSAQATISKTLDNKISLSILGVGTPQGGTILYDGELLRNSQGETIIAKLQPQLLKAIAEQNQGIYRSFSADDSDINALVSHSTNSLKERRQSERQFDQWQEFGPYLLLGLIPIALLGFRRGWILCLLLLPIYSEPSFAVNWQDLWLRQDQQAAKAFKEQDMETAAEQFNDSRWRGAAAYKGGNYENALKDFSEHTSTATDFYNRGNAEARLQQYQQAIESYEQALELDPSLTDAAFNRDLLKKLLQNQQQEQSESGQSENQQNDQNQSEGDGQPQDGQDGSEGKQQAGDKPEGQQQNRENAENNQDTGQRDQQQNQQAENSQKNPANDTDESAAKNAEQQQALNQWLRKIPDDPSGLLRRKFEYEFRKRRQQYRQGQWQPPENDAHLRY